MGSESNHVTGVSSLFIAASGWEVNKYIDEGIFFILLACISETLIRDYVQQKLKKLKIPIKFGESLLHEKRFVSCCI